ncbi:GABA-B receptor [Skeletonema marinoi]|uniref:GABA-B receptor n=1 Tax=Skeletonema marinoi TaxID=267567 RepID=A0AAD8Y6C1_9STRA|nr:GABA-B receptor [Skeletonema marinoi]
MTASCCHLLYFLLALTIATTYAQEPIDDAIEDNGLSNLNLPPCPATSYEISQYGPETPLSACILYDLNPRSDDALFVNSTINSTNAADQPSFTEVGLVQVTPSGCHNHRDGANTAISKLNNDNDGRGVAIGHFGTSYIKFRLISIIGGNNNNIGNDAYSAVHEEILDEVFQNVDNVHFMLGSCSFASANDKPMALKHAKIVLSQVGPPGFYMDVANNPYVFGIHVNSDTYSLPALKALQFHLDATGESTKKQPVRVVYRDRSEFFKSTCRSAIDAATLQGFDVTAIEFNPDGEEMPGVPNSQNAEFLEGLADQLCSADEGPNTNNAAVIACVQERDADVMIARMRLNGCRPTLAWFTTATWGWATDNADTIPLFLGGGQWHENFVYSDKYFETGKAVLEYGKEKFGYMGSYDHVVSYAMPMLIVELLTSFFKIADSPNVTDTLVNRYEEIRRSLTNINAHTIFGPVSFNEYQRNDGRGAAGTQWVQKGNVTAFQLGCISPLDQADVPIVIPSPSSLPCPPGSYIDQNLVEGDPAILADKCTLCPAGTFAQYENTNLLCQQCFEGSISLEGANYCVATKDNLTSVGLQVLGIIFVVVSWSSTIGYMVWLYLKRKNPVVKMSQPESLFLLCVGAFISTSAIIPLTLAEAAPGESTRGASAACRSIPFLYSLGWVLMYTSLTAKSWRLFKVARNAELARRVRVSVREIYVMVAVVLLVDVSILIAWVVVAPLQYIRTNVSTTLNEATGVMTVETAGSCQGSANDVSMWAFLGPIIIIHVASMIVTNVILFKVKGISDRYQEQKYVALASIYICELVLLGLPILIAVQESGEARYIVIAGVIFLTDTGVLALIFLPKIKYAKVGLPEGMTVTESIGIKRTNVKSQAGRGSDYPVSAVEEIRRRASMTVNRNSSVLSSQSEGPAVIPSPVASVISVASSGEEKVDEIEESDYDDFQDAKSTCSTNCSNV